MTHRAEGTHVILDLHGCNKELLNSESVIRNALDESCKLANCKILKKLVYKFQPQGVTGILLLEESHIAIHTYPEHGSCFIDIYTCGDKATPEMAIRFLEDFFESKNMEVKKIHRGKNGD